MNKKLRWCWTLIIAIMVYESLAFHALGTKAEAAAMLSARAGRSTMDNQKQSAQTSDQKEQQNAQNTQAGTRRNGQSTASPASANADAGSNAGVAATTNNGSAQGQVSAGSAASGETGDPHQSTRGDVGASASSGADTDDTIALLNVPMMGAISPAGLVIASLLDGAGHKRLASLHQPSALRNAVKAGSLGNKYILGMDRDRYLPPPFFLIVRPTKLPPTVLIVPTAEPYTPVIFPTEIVKASATRIAQWTAVATTPLPTTIAMPSATVFIAPMPSATLSATPWPSSTATGIADPLGPTYTPAPTLTPRPTLTPLPTLTPRATLTSIPTLTPRATLTPLPSP